MPACLLTRHGLRNSKLPRHSELRQFKNHCKHIAIASCLETRPPGISEMTYSTHHYTYLPIHPRILHVSYILPSIPPSPFPFPLTSHPSPPIHVLLCHQPHPTNHTLTHHTCETGHQPAPTAPRFRPVHTKVPGGPHAQPYSRTCCGAETGSTSTSPAAAMSSPYCGTWRVCAFAPFLRQAEKTRDDAVCRRRGISVVARGIWRVIGVAEGAKDEGR